MHLMRYADEQTKEKRDFSPRRRVPTLLQFGLIFVVLYSVLAVIYFYSASMIAFMAWSFVVVALLAGVMTHTVRYNRDLMLATEFQNAMFAEAVGAHYLFSLIVRNDGSVAHTDRGFQTLFPLFLHARHRHLNDIITIANITRADGTTIYASIDSETPVQLSLTLTQPDGSALPLILTVDPLTRPGPFILIRARQFIEKREGKQAKQSVAAPNNLAVWAESLMQVAHHLPIGLLSANEEGYVTYANRWVESLLGYAEGEMVTSRLHIGRLFVGAEHYADQLEFNGEVELNTKNGEVVQCDAQLQSTYIEGQPKAMVAVFELPDVTSEAVPVSPANIPAAVTSPLVSGGATFEENLMASAPIAMVVTDAQGKIESCNQAFHVLTQHRFSAHLPPMILELFEADHTDAMAQLRTVFSGELTRPIAMEMALPDGETLSVSLYHSVVDADQRFVFYCIDVTEQKNLEHRFSHSQKMQAVGQLAGGVAHDFNNLLTAMIGFCDLLLMRHPAGDQSFADIMQIKQNANRAANLVRQLLAFSRRQVLQPKTLDMTDVLAELSNLIRRLIGENIELKMQHGRNLGMVKADQGQLEQVLINLAVNARDAMKNGGELVIESMPVTVDANRAVPIDLVAPPGEDKHIPQGEYVVVNVTDTGTGIEPNVLPKIFEPFFSTKEIGSGTGLGLSTVYGIIKQTGGYLFIHSALGQGTTFSIYFPSVEPDAHIGATAESTENTPHTDLTGRACILLVEDEAPVRMFAARALGNKGYTVIEADSAETGLEIMSERGGEIDVIITDVIMPGMNGPTMVEQVIKDHPSLKVIFISGYAEDVFVDNYNTEEDFNFLAKPFTLKQLAAKVKEVMA